jgi:cell wall-associated NlpC family hydrolase
MTTRKLAAMLSVVILAALFPALSAHGAPSRASVQDEINRLARDIAVLDEEYNLSRLALGRLERRIREAEQRRSEAQTHREAIRRAASARAAAVYRAGMPSVLMALFDSQSLFDFDRRMQAVSVVGEWESDLVASLRQAQERADQAAADLRQEREGAREQASSIAAKRRELKRKVEEQRKLLVRVRGAGLPKRVPVPVAIPELSGPLSERARVAVQTALAQLGKPYRWGAEGPDSYDCSGLTMYAWRAAGVSLPHSSRAQYRAAPRVERDQLQPGDLVFFGRPIHHVGMYIGEGNMVVAPQSGDHVRISTIARRDYAGAVRPGA